MKLGIVASADREAFPDFQGQGGLQRPLRCRRPSAAGKYGMTMDRFYKNGRHAAEADMGKNVKPA